MAFKGLRVELPVGQGGLVGTYNPQRVSPDQLLEALNISLENGFMEREKGSVLYTPEAVILNGAIAGGHDWWPTSAIQRMIVITSLGNVYKEEPLGVFTQIGTLEVMWPVPVFVEGGQEAAAQEKKLFIFSDGPGKVLKGNGTALTLLGEGALQKPLKMAASMHVPGAPGNVTQGAHSYVVTFYQADGKESLPSDKSNQVVVYDPGINGVVTLTYPIGPPGTVGRKIYRTVALDTGPHKLLYDIAENTSTSVNDNVADASLGANAPTVGTATGRPIEWSGNNFPTFGFMHLGRLVCGGVDNDPHRLYYSTGTDHENFLDSAAGSILVYPGDGERLVGGISFKGLAILWKYPRGMYAIDTRDPDPARWSLTKLSGFIGGVSPHGHVVIDDDVLFLDSTGSLQLLSGIQQFGDLGQRNLSSLSEMDTFVRDRMEIGTLRRSHMVYYTTRGQVPITMFSKGEQTSSDQRLILDFNQVDRPRFHLGDGDYTALWLQKDPTTNIQNLVGGSSDGKVFLLDQPVLDRDGEAYTTRFKMVETDLGYVDQSLATKTKNAQFLELAFEPRENGSLTIHLWWDGQPRETVIFDMSFGGPGLGEIILDEYMFPLSAGHIRTIKRRITGGGRFLALEGVSDEVGKDFALLKAWLYFTPVG